MIANLKSNHSSDNWKHTYVKIRQLLIDRFWTYIDNNIFNTDKPITIEEKHFKIDDRIWNDPFFEIVEKHLMIAQTINSFIIISVISLRTERMNHENVYQ